MTGGQDAYSAGAFDQAPSPVPAGTEREPLEAAFAEVLRSHRFWANWRDYLCIDCGAHFADLGGYREHVARRLAAVVSSSPATPEGGRKRWCGREEPHEPHPFSSMTGQSPRYCDGIAAPSPASPAETGGGGVVSETRSEKWARLAKLGDGLVLEMEVNREIAAALKAARVYPADVNLPNADNTSRHLALRGELEDSQRREAAWARKCHDLEVRLDEVVAVGQEIEQERLDQHHARQCAEDHLAAVRAICAAAHPYEDFGAFIDRIEAATINGSAPSLPGEQPGGEAR